MKDKALENFNCGYGCSESIVKAAVDMGLCPENLLKVSAVFRRGMASGCLCGAIAGAQMVLGSILSRDEVTPAAKLFIEKFKERNKATCCRVLTAGLVFNSAERRQNCSKMVADCAEILEEFVKTKVS